MKLQLFILGVMVFFAASPNALGACGVKATIIDFMSSADCEVEISMERAKLVSETRLTYEGYELMPDDLDIVARVKGCDFENKYFFTLREDPTGYKVVEHRAFKLPR